MSQTTDIEAKYTSSLLSGEMALWEVATADGLEYNEANIPILMGLVEDCPSQPHPKPALAAAGHLVYDYEKHLAKRHDHASKQSTTLKKDPLGSEKKRLFPEFFF